MNFYGAYTIQHQLCEEQILAHTSSSLKSPNKPHHLRTGFIICTLYMKKLRLREIKELCPHHKLRDKSKIWNWIFVCKAHVFSIPLNCYLWFMLKHYITAGKLRPLLFLLTKHFLPWLSECPREIFFIPSLLPSLGQWISDLNKVTKGPSLCLIWLSLLTIRQQSHTLKPFLIRASNLCRNSTATSH